MGNKALKKQSRLTALKNSLLRLVSLLRQLGADTLWRYKWRVLGIVTTTISGIVCQVSTVLIAVYFARFLEKGTVIHALGYEIAPRQSISLMIAVGVGLGLALALGAVLLYTGKSMGCRLSREYEEFCISRVFKIISTKGAMFARGIPLPQVGINKLVGIDSRMCGRALLKLLELPAPTCYFLISTISLCVIDFWAFGVLTIILFSSLRLIYKINTNAASNFEDYEKHSPGTSLAKRNLVNRLNMLSSDLFSTNAWIDQLCHASPQKKNLDAYEGFLRSTETSVFLHGLILAAMISCVVIFMGIRVITQEQGWGQLLVFLIAMRVTLSSQRQLITISNALSRFSPQLKRYFNFINVHASDHYKLELIETNESSSLPSLNLNKSRLNEIVNSSHFSIITNLPFSVYTANWAFENILLSQNIDLKSNNFYAVGKGYSCPHDLSLAACMEGKIDEDRLEDFISKADLSEIWHDVCPQGLNQIVSGNIWSNIPINLKMILGLLAAEASMSDWLFFEASGLYSIPQKTRRLLFNDLNINKIVSIYSFNTDAITKIDGQHVVVLGNNGLVAWGDTDWFKFNQKDILSRLPDPNLYFKEDIEGLDDKSCDNDMEVM